MTKERMRERDNQREIRERWRDFIVCFNFANPFTNLPGDSNERGGV